MAILAHRFAYKFEKFKINLCGSMSTIQLRYSSGKGGKNNKYKLYKSEGESEDDFNQALVFLLEALGDLVNEVQRIMKAYPELQEDADLKLRCYTVQKEEIGGKSIKYSYNESESWTTAMRYFLMNLQWLIYKAQ